MEKLILNSTNTNQTPIILDANPDTAILPGQMNNHNQIAAYPAYPSSCHEFYNPDPDKRKNVIKFKLAAGGDVLGWMV